MEGLFFRAADCSSSDVKTKDLALLAKHGNIEIITQTIKQNATAWLEPPQDEETFEFFYLLSGDIEIISDKQGTIRVSSGDSFILTCFRESFLLKCLSEAKMLYVTNKPSYDSSAFWQNKLNEQLQRIEDKDHYTRRHSRSVMKYAVDLYEELNRSRDRAAMEHFVMSALFHDIGKCSIPIEILNKPGKLTDREFDVIRKHAEESRRILEPLFGKEVADFAGKHHERMDGSGYPEGLRGDDIPIEVRILMVADSFDAMTSDRVYSKAKTMEAAARELCGMNDKYDPAVTAALMRLVKKKYMPEEQKTE